MRVENLSGDGIEDEKSKNFGFVSFLETSKIDKFKSI